MIEEMIKYGSFQNDWRESYVTNSGSLRQELVNFYGTVNSDVEWQLVLVGTGKKVSVTVRILTVSSQVKCQNLLVRIRNQLNCQRISQLELVTTQLLDNQLVRISNSLIVS